MVLSASAKSLSNISIHASRGGSDSAVGNHRGLTMGFQSTLPAGEATMPPYKVVYIFHNFNPRFPRGKRPQSPALPPAAAKFQSTLPAGEATAVKVSRLSVRQISIHASRGGSDKIAPMKGADITIFQSTLPAGEATLMTFTLTASSSYFNPRFPRGKRLDASR